MTYFLKKGNTFTTADEKSLDIYDELPAGNYIIKKDQYDNFFFEEIDSFKPVEKVYGDTTKSVSRIIMSFNAREVSTGVLLTGEKGSGKTMMAKLLAIKLAESNMPCIVINTPWFGEKFNTLIQSIQQPCMILFDEFEKVYDSEQQASILTLLDGVFPTKKLFVLTCNDKWRIDQHMRNRPGRIFYLMEFHGLTMEFITEYCNEKLINKSHIDGVQHVGSLFAEFNFDMLQALVEEMNRFNESAADAMKLLNARPQCDDNGRFKVELTVGGNELPEGAFRPKEWDGNPLSQELFCIKQVVDNGDVDHGDIPTSTYGESLGNSSVKSSGNHVFTYLDLSNVNPAASSVFVAALP